MANKEKIIYNWDEETGEAFCTIFNTVRGRDRLYTGTAFTHPDDADMKSELVGEQIAEWRAHIKMLQDYMINEIEPGLAALKQLYYSMNRSKNFNPKSYEAKMLFRQIRIKEDDLAFCKQAIANTKHYIKEYIDRKDKNYQLIRKNRNNK